MTTHLTNTFTSARLLAATMTSILLPGVLAPTAFSGTNDGSLNFSNTPFVRPEPTITTFDAPGAGTGPGQGTIVFAVDCLNPAGAITATSVDANDVSHGVLRAPDGTMTTFDVPGAGTGPGQGTLTFGINQGGTIEGAYIDSSDVAHGFVRSSTAPSQRSTFRALAQVLAKAPYPRTSTRLGWSRDSTSTLAM